MQKLWKLSLLSAALIGLASPVFASGDIEPKDTVQNEGLGGMDAPSKKIDATIQTPAPTKKKAAEKKPETPTEKAPASGGY